MRFGVLVPEPGSRKGYIGFKVWGFRVPMIELLARRMKEYIAKTGMIFAYSLLTTNNMMLRIV